MHAAVWGVIGTMFVGAMSAMISGVSNVHGTDWLDKKKRVDGTSDDSVI